MRRSGGRREGVDGNEAEVGGGGGGGEEGRIRGWEGGRNWVYILRDKHIKSTGGNKEMKSLIEREMMNRRMMYDK